ncbi:arsR-family transcriptional regulator [Micromonospora sp. ATCC 39149]|uniref:Helix-turn-helix transcriptional regulator n=1 Tax=Micromonospora carbonacea TaxID=47853 RepID=A0A7D6CCA9_9ACTN|nr:helix-turn-helix domain-containing protein [Micromonospora sp. ATCC 39149]EEP69773.1 arsR-family transcriptional regulator [Micromonospora sp. ATCC 39149]QLJ96250.1 helix-turn-helix transcriptional regulator [Micromonospora carbonacea]
MTLRSPADEAPRACDGGLTRAFAFLGKRWNGMLLGTLGQGPAGFAELARALPGISESVLSDRLGELARVGLVSRTVREGPPLGVSYELTERGAALLPALDALARWAHENLPAGGCR